jgi:hypothetical protein
MVNIKKANLSFSGHLTPLNKKRITRIVMHHMAHQSWGITQVHNYHRNGNGWSGIGYNWWIDFKGNVYEGRGWNQGAHASGYNTTSLGIGYQGDFTKQTMPDAQLQAGIELNNWLIAELGLSASAIVGHNQVGSTACPGKNFRMSELKNGAVSGSSSSKPSTGSSSTGIQWVGTNDKGKRIEAIVPSVNYYDTQRWTNPSGSFKKGDGWIVDNLYRVNGSLQYRVQNSNGDLYYITARPDLVRIAGGGSESSSSSSSSDWTLVTGNWTGQTLKKGQHGEPVRQMQQMMADNSPPFYPEKGAKNNGVDSYFGNNTENCVRRYQSYHGLTVDGLPGRQTYNSLR